MLSSTESINGKASIKAKPVMYYSLNDKLYLNPAAMFSMKSFDSCYSLGLTNIASGKGWSTQMSSVFLGMNLSVLIFSTAGKRFPA
jgi:hypothetical protein